MLKLIFLCCVALCPSLVFSKSSPPAEKANNVHLVINVGNHYLIGGFFQEDKLLDKFRIDEKIDWQTVLKLKLQHYPQLVAALIGSVNSKFDEPLMHLLRNKQIPYIAFADYHSPSFVLAIPHPEEIPPDRLANGYGALKLYPNCPLIIIDIGTSVTIDAVAPNRTLLGGAIYPGFAMSAWALHEKDDRVPHYTTLFKPTSPLAKDTQTNVCSGIYYGFLGALQLFIQKLKEECFPGRTDVMVIATGGLTHPQDCDSKLSTCTIGYDLVQDLKKYGVDALEPDLTLVGLYEILKEKLNLPEKGEIK